LKFKGGHIEDLDLYFTLPGRDDWELVPNGANIQVTIHNLEEYTDLVFRQILKDGIQKQFSAFCEGFNLIFPLESLGAFSASELNLLLCGAPETLGENWTKETLLENIKSEHGYSNSSRAVVYLVNILSQFTHEERRAFVRFVTGSPRLPIGGFKSLVPKLTIVRKKKKHTDKFLPSVNTCFYYLKLPDYSSEAVMKDKLLQVISTVGQQGFSLS